MLRTSGFLIQFWCDIVSMPYRSTPRHSIDLTCSQLRRMYFLFWPTRINETHELNASTVILPMFKPVMTAYKVERLIALRD